jgi:hypothetical protein
VTLPPPIGGWNTRDDPVRMEPTDATHLVNFYPEINEVKVRGGYVVHADIEDNTGVQTDTTNYLDGGDIAAFEFGASQDFSVEFWVKHSGGSQTATIVGKRAGATGAGWQIGIDETLENVWFVIEDVSNNNVVATAVDGCPNDGNWHHVAFTVDRTGDEIKAYHNAVEDSSSPYDISSVTGALSSGTSAFRVFDNSVPDDHWDNGYIDELRIWNDVRTQNEILENYTTEIAAEASLIGYWLMQGPQGTSVTTITDASASGNTLTDTGAGDITFVHSNTAFERQLTIDTVAEFFDGSVRKLVAASPSAIYDATTAGQAASLGTGFSNGRWQTAMMDGVMGLVNGEDAPQTYDGATLGAMTVSGTTASELVGIHIFKNRSYFWKADSPSFWYSAVDALGGALTEFTLGEIALRGGYLLDMHNWTVDGGAGVDDYAVFIMSSGEVLVYQGSDPGAANDWALVGSYQIPTPLDRRGIFKLGSEIAVLTDTDIVLIPSSFNRPTPPSTKLSGAIQLAGPTYRTNFGWSALYYGTRNMLLINVPISATESQQYVMNMETGAPARFTNQDAASWVVFNDELYFGTYDGRVMQADIGSSDNGAQINADARQAWTDLGIATDKKVEAFRVIFSGTTGLNVGAEIAYDFENATISRGVTTGGSSLPWGSPWGSPWSTQTGIYDDWRLNNGFGQVMSCQVSMGVEGERPSWYRTDILVGEAPNL